jgi:Anaphase-promoting complex, cyclosome, subunit 3
MGAPPQPNQGTRTNASSSAEPSNSSGTSADPAASSFGVAANAGSSARVGGGAGSALTAIRTIEPRDPQCDDSDANANSKNDAVDATTRLHSYLSLIQQYLAVFMVDNATFLAERCVAEHPDSPDAAYLLALCHYRVQNPKRARIVLDEASAAHCSISASMSPSGNDDDTTVRSSIRYLSAVCSYELHDYSRAEDALLADCRLAFLRAASGNNSSTSSASATSAAAFPRSMDDWIVQTTVRFRTNHCCSQSTRTPQSKFSF